MSHPRRLEILSLLASGERCVCDLQDDLQTAQSLPSIRLKTLRDAGPDQVRRSMDRWAGCLAGELKRREFPADLAQAGFADAAIEPPRVSTAADARTFLTEQVAFDEAADDLARRADRFVSALVRATKPSAGNR